MTSSAARHLIDLLLEMPEFLDRAFAGLRSDLLTAASKYDKSPFAEHAWHVRDCESDLYGPRIYKVLDQESPFLEPMRVGHWPTERRYLEREVSQALSEFRSLRTDLVERLRKSRDEDLERSGRRADGRSSTIVDLIAELLEHDQDHRKRLASMLSGLQAHAA